MNHKGLIAVFKLLLFCAEIQNSDSGDASNNVSAAAVLFNGLRTKSTVTPTIPTFPYISSIPSLFSQHVAQSIAHFGIDLLHWTDDL